MEASHVTVASRVRLSVIAKSLWFVTVTSSSPSSHHDWSRVAPLSPVWREYVAVEPSASVGALSHQVWLDDPTPRGARPERPPPPPPRAAGGRDPPRPYRHPGPTRYPHGLSSVMPSCIHTSRQHSRRHSATRGVSAAASALAHHAGRGTAPLPRGGPAAGPGRAG